MLVYTECTRLLQHLEADYARYPLGEGYEHAGQHTLVFAPTESNAQIAADTFKSSKKFSG
ncbi:MAG: hypothetical protein AAF219_10440 [Myxococcota bacterium]